MNRLHEPTLMAFQNFPLNGDTYAQEEFKRLQKKHNLRVAIETGTCLGYTTAFLAEVFPVVKTIEINPNFVNIAITNRLNDLENVQCFLGSSSSLLKHLLKGCGDDTFIFLDAHWNKHCPLRDELSQIAKSGIRPVIAIHDFFVPDHPELGFDSYESQPFTFQWLEDLFAEIYGVTDYTYHYNSKSEGANRGIIYLESK